MTDAPEKPVESLSFEEALAELERVVTDLEGGSIPLDRSITLYERGAKLRQHCEAKLAEAEEKVQAITTAAEGSVTGTRPFDPD